MSHIEPNHFEPKHFTDIIGNTVAVAKILKEAAMNRGYGGLAFYIHGETGTGKSLLADCIAREAGANPDENGLASGLTRAVCMRDAETAAIIEQILHGARTKPMYNDCDVYIFDEVDGMSPDNMRLWKLAADEIERAKRAGKCYVTVIFTTAKSDKQLTKTQRLQINEFTSRCVHLQTSLTKHDIDTFFADKGIADISEKIPLLSMRSALEYYRNWSGEVETTDGSLRTAEDRSLKTEKALLENSLAKCFTPTKINTVEETRQVVEKMKEKKKQSESRPQTAERKNLPSAVCLLPSPLPPDGFQLRDYQLQAVEAAENSRGKGLIVLPTGSGKTVVIAELCRRLIAEGNRITILAPRKELVRQTSEHLQKHLDGEVIGVNCAGLNHRDKNTPVVVSTIHSIYQTGCNIDEQHVFIIDEAHYIPKVEKGMFYTLFRKYKRSRFIGLTATPFRTNGGTIFDESGFFDNVVFAANVPDLIRKGYLSRPYTAFSERVNESVLAVRNGDYTEKSQHLYFTGAKTETALLKVLKEVGKEKTLIFGASIAHCLEISNFFKRLGIKCPAIHSQMRAKERQEAVDWFYETETGFASNCNVLATGFDAPNIRNIVLLRATKSSGLYVQMVGRGFRIAPGKRSFRVFDFGGNIDRCGAIDDPKIDRDRERESATKAGTGTLLGTRDVTGKLGDSYSINGLLSTEHRGKAGRGKTAAVPQPLDWGYQTKVVNGKTVRVWVDAPGGLTEAKYLEYVSPLPEKPKQTFFQRLAAFFQ